MLPPFPSYPPVTSASPLFSKRARWSVRPVFKLPVTLRVPLEELYSSALVKAPPPPAMSTSPLFRREAVWLFRDCCRLELYGFPDKR